MQQQILLSLTFVFGVIALLTYTKIFDTKISGFFEAISPFKLKPFFIWVDLLVFIFSLCYQSWYWLFRK